MTIKLTSSDLNLLIYHYLEERGLHHTAFALKQEGTLSKDQVVPGKLLEMLHKGLLLDSIQAHSAEDTACTAPFTLLRHECPQHAARPGPRDLLLLETHSARLTALCFAKESLLTG